MIKIKILTPGPKGKIPEEIYVVVEVPSGSKLKYELKGGHLFLDRVLRYDVSLPGDYGIIPQTLSEDGEELDCILLVSQSNFPGSIVKARPVGYLETEDEKGRDKKIIAVPTDDVDVGFSKIKKLEDVPKNTRDKIVFYFTNYKTLEKGKWTKIGGFKSRDEAKKLINRSIEEYKKRYKHKL